MNNSSAHYVSPANALLAFLIAILLLSACSGRRTRPPELDPPHPVPLPEIWIGDRLEAIRFDNTADTGAYHQLSNAQGFTLSVSLRADSNLLHFRSRYSILRKHAPAGSFKQYTLKINQQTDSSLTLTPTSAESCAFFGNKNRLFFKKQAFAIDTTICFEKIVFHTTECLGNCSVFHVEIDSEKRIRQHAEVLYKKSNRDATGEGHFTSNVPDSTYHNLIAAIKTSNLRQLQSDEILCCDAPIITIILYANGQRTSFRSMSPPIVAQNLVDILYRIARKQLGTPTRQPFTLEGWNGKPSTDPGNFVPL
jgi:hypothetical protein